MAEKKILSLAEASLLRGLTTAEVAHLESCGEMRGYRDGETIFVQGSPGDEVFILMGGRVMITVAMELASQQAPVHTVVPGKVFGEFALVADHERSASAVAVKDSVCFVLSRQAFHRLAGTDPHLGYVVLRDLGEILVGRIIKTTQELRASLLY